ncbi:type II inositol 1,4,5-trisphosphate 5-phosphatase [Scaptodrosophila lebanonensis]|uniref:Type II inositol 1,4,5-trisphosphate 5-phosphatase n=1 Tax=Drosophila lebanonensis TaxID=7225 RepID=A0A6J2TX41_DROLE|nr:type II inositol 1,4,5-trisphosphate 5-phosphatase [Scaptodrosophila lebanonensis]
MEDEHEPTCRPNGSTSTGSGDDISATNAPPPPSLLQIVQKKFKDNEKVHSIFEAYQLKNQEHANRILAVVSSLSGGTYAIISLSIVRTPIRFPTDLTCTNVFPLNESFQILVDGNKGFKSQLKFELLTGDGKPATFYYYIMKSEKESLFFDDFYAQIVSFKMSMSDRHLSPDFELSYVWLNDYRQVGEVKQELKNRESEYTVYNNYKIYCATWNVNDKSFMNSNMNLWLSCSTEPPDIYAIALQELNNSTEAVILKDTRLDPAWIRKMLDSVHPDSQYEELRSVRLVGLLLTIIVRKGLKAHISRCRINSITRGILKMMGNKGAVAISLQLNEGNICFVNSHLAAHMANVAERNQDYNIIEKDLMFDDDQRHIRDHDHIFWIGDLNYRLQIPPDIPASWLRDKNNPFEAMLIHDQLLQERVQRNCFVDYMEGDIKFCPTYKYNPGTDNYDTEKMRAPAYCDRILWKGDRIEQLAYNSVMEMRESDHKPVYAIFNVKIKTRDEKKYKRVQEEVLKAVDKRENDNQPQITVDTTVIDFGVVTFNELAIRDFTVSNNCPLPVNFQFRIKDPPLNAICEKWLKVDPHNDTLPIDTERTIRVKLLPDVRSIRGLLKKIRTTNLKFDFDTLILHVENGADKFISVTGSYQPSCFGLSMETLCRTDRPMCQYSQEDIKQLMNDVTPDYRVTMPREFFLLIDYLHKQGPKLVGTFQTDKPQLPLVGNFNLVRDWLDTWSEDPFPGDAQSAAVALLLLLKLPEQPLLEPLVGHLLESKSKAEAMEYIDILSAPKRNVFMHLCMFLRVGIECQYYELHQVASVFGRILLRSKEYTRGDFNTRCSEVMMHFIGPDIMDNPPLIGNGGGNVQVSAQFLNTS